MSGRVLSRRRFLAVVGCASGALLVADRVGADETPGSDGAHGGAPGAGGQAGVVVVAVESGFVDATSWQGELLTLRAGPSGMVVRSELAERDYEVEVLDGFAGRCLGAHGNLLVIGGHRVVRTGTMTFEAGTPYETLLAQAGPEAKLLAAQPGRPVVTPYRHVFIERFPALVATADMRDWKHVDVPLGVGTGGSFGAVLERVGVLAGDLYAIAEVPDSVVEASLISLADAVRGEASAARGSISLDHGSLWGASDTGVSDLVIVADRTGTRGYDSRNQAVVSLANDDWLLGINPEAGSLEAAVQTRDGAREIKRFRSGIEKETATLTDEALIKHRISPHVTIASPDGKHALISHTNIAHSTTA